MSPRKRSFISILNRIYQKGIRHTNLTSDLQKRRSRIVRASNKSSESIFSYVLYVLNITWTIVAIASVYTVWYTLQYTYYYRCVVDTSLVVQITVWYIMSINILIQLLYSVRFDRDVNPEIMNRRRPMFNCNDWTRLVVSILQHNILRMSSRLVHTKVYQNNNYRLDFFVIYLCDRGGKWSITATGNTIVVCALTYQTVS